MCELNNINIAVLLHLYSTKPKKKILTFDKENKTKSLGIWTHGYMIV